MAAKAADAWKRVVRGDPVDWLLERDHPCVRYWTLRRILGKPEADRDIAASRAAIVEYSPVADALRELQAASFIDSVDLSVLAMVGVSRKHPAVARACEMYFGRDRSSNKWDGCYPGHAVGALIRLGYGGDARLKPMVRRIVEDHPFFDGNRPGTGLRYGRLAGCCTGSHSCMSAVAWSLWAIAAIPARKRTDQERAFLREGAEFLRAHRLYQANHHQLKVVRPEWLRLHLPFGLGWRVDALHLLDVAGQVGLAGDVNLANALGWLISKQDAQGRWLLEERNPDRTRCCESIWQEETVGQPSKWVTLAALMQLKRRQRLLAKLDSPKGSTSRSAGRSEAPFADYPFVYKRQEEQRARERWRRDGFGQHLAALLKFADAQKLKRGWHWGLVIGPAWCREWLHAKTQWVPRPRFTRAWPTCRLFFITPRGQFSDQQLSARLGICIEDEEAKGAFPRLYRTNFWRIKLEAWRDEWDEVALTLQLADQWERVWPVLEEAMASMKAVRSR